MIRQQFHIDPYKLSTEEYSQLVTEAIWLKQYDQKAMENAMSSVVSKLFPKENT